MISLIYLKKKAAGIYKQIQNEYGDNSCGVKLTEYINPRIYPLKCKFNKVWDKIRAIDKSAPKSPFKIKEKK